MLIPSRYMSAKRADGNTNVQAFELVQLQNTVPLFLPVVLSGNSGQQRQVYAFVIVKKFGQQGAGLVGEQGSASGTFA